MFQTVIFDLDGTVLNTLEDLAAAGNWICRRKGWPEHTVEGYRQLVGTGMRNLLRLLDPMGDSDPGLDDALAEYMDYYGQHCLEKTAPYPGIPALLAELKSRGVKLAVYSNKGDRFCGEIVEHFFPGVFDVIRGKVDGVPVKPDPAGLALVMNALGAETATTLYVGDSNVDMETAKNGDLVSCGVTWGFRGRQELEEAGAVHLADTAEELQALILRP
jgi:phosphoglycolate phosphatase